MALRNLSKTYANTEKAMAYIKDRCLKNGMNKATEFVHKNGAKISVTPCTADPESEEWDEVDFFCVECDTVYLPGYFQLVNIANVLLYLDEVIQDNLEEQARLELFRKDLDRMKECEEKEYQKQLYSDCYKSCYGYRPEYNFEPVTLAEKPFN